MTAAPTGICSWILIKQSFSLLFLSWKHNWNTLHGLEPYFTLQKKTNRIIQNSFAISQISLKSVSCLTKKWGLRHRQRWLSSFGTTHADARHASHSFVLPGNQVAKSIVALSPCELVKPPLQWSRPSVSPPHSRHCMQRAKCAVLIMA